MVLDEILVTAQRREQRLQDVPVSVSVATGDAMEEAGLRSMEDVTARMPNVKLSSGAIVNNLVIRGVGSGNNAGFEQSVGTFVDGIYRARSRSTRAALLDVERLEVLKGPQTTFFGANVIAGALNIVTRKPTQEFSYDARALYVPTTEEYSVEGGVGGPLSDTLGLRVAGRVSGMNGYVENMRTGEDGPHDRSLQGRVALQWRPSSAITSDFRFDAGRSRTDNAMPLELVGCPPDEAYSQPPTSPCVAYLNANGGAVDDALDYRTDIGPNYADYDFYEAALTNSIDIGNGTIVSTTGYFNHDYETRGQVIPFPYPGTVQGFEGQPTYQEESYKQFSQELRYQSDTGGTIDYMLGGYFSSDDLDMVTNVGFFFVPFGAFNPLGTTDVTTPVTGSIGHAQESRTLSGFGSVTARPADRLRVNLGLRYSNIHKEAERNYLIGAGDATVRPEGFQAFDPDTMVVMNGILGSELGNFADPERTDDQFMPSVSLQYDLTPNVMGYVSYANGFKAGGYSSSATPAVFGPESVDSYELGIKGAFFDRRLTINAALYQSNYEDLQESTLIAIDAGTVVTLIRNVAESRSRGVEVGADLRVSPNLSLSADIAYLDAVYTSYPNGACTTLGGLSTPDCVQDLSGKRRAYAPEWSGNIGATISVPVNDRFEVRAEPLVYFSSEYFLSASADPLLKQDSYAKVDLRLSVGPTDEAWEFAVIGRNLTDQETTGFMQSVTGAPGSVSYLPDPPRTVGFQFSVRH